MVSKIIDNSVLYQTIPFEWNKETYHAQLWLSTSHLPGALYDLLTNNHSIATHPDYLRIKHRDNQPVFVFSIQQNGNFIGASSVYYAEVDVNLSGKEITQNSIAQVLYDFIVHPLFKNKGVLCLGSLFISGEKGSNYNSDLIAEHQWHELLVAGFGTWNLATQKHHKCVGWLGLDICNSSACLSSQNHHIPLQFEPVMNLDISKMNSFESYTDLLKAKYRTKLNRAKSKGESLSIKTINPQDFNTLKPRIEQLFNEVKKRSNYYGGKFNVSDLLGLNQRFSNTYTTGFFLDQQLVGFTSSIVNGTTYLAHMVGTDYALNKSHSIYENMLYFFIEDAIKHSCKQILLGRTALQIKSSVGAFPVYHYCCLQFNKCWWQKLGKFVAKRITINQPNFRKAFKDHDVLQPTL